MAASCQSNTLWIIVSKPTPPRGDFMCGNHLTRYGSLVSKKLGSKNSPPIKLSTVHNPTLPIVLRSAFSVALANFEKAPSASDANFSLLLISTEKG